MSKPEHIILLLLLYKCSPEVVREEREEEWVHTRDITEKGRRRKRLEGETEGKMRIKMKTLINFAASVFALPPKIRNKKEK